MRLLPNGISNYEELVEKNRIYVDKTMYIEKLESISDCRIMFLRPRKFGKSLFTSVLENYYDINKKEKFEKLFKNTYIGKNPTPNKNNYYILRFNFSGIDSSSEEKTMRGFKNKVKLGIKDCILTYNIDFDVEMEEDAEDILSEFFVIFKQQRKGEKLYVIIDEYDHFANELLGFQTELFKKLVATNGKIRKWYENLKAGTESVVDRIFITGVAPITLDSTTSGFNIASDLTKNIKFNDMLGFTKEDVKYVMTELEIPKEKQEELMPIIKENYDGYIFSDLIEEDFEQYRMYNSNMTLYFLNEYQEQGKIPKKLIDINIISDYQKIAGLMDIYKDPSKKSLLENIVAKKKVESKIVEKFNCEIEFREKELISLLFYLGYLTINKNGLAISQFRIPNAVIEQVYSEFLLTYINNILNIKDNSIEIETMAEEILYEGKIDKIAETLGNYLTQLSNRDYQRYDEKYVKLMFYMLAQMITPIFTKSELELSEGYSDILMIPRDKLKERYAVLIEFKYIKAEDYSDNLLKQKQQEARKQIEKYKQTEEIKMLKNIRSYTIVAVKDKLYIEEI